MSLTVSRHALDVLSQFLAGAADLSLAGGEVRLVWAPLPGRTGVAATTVDGVTWVVIDEATPMFRAHTAELFADAQALCDGDGVLRLRSIPTRGPDPLQPCRLELVS